ncbi:sugar isomerase domain-containing protein [Jiangella ureilytica]|uniref:Sugar isomerase domain-containing protein n=1 Tax=Jiangella ureilytica TaxID=2530374 RepID=A0A4R4RQT0_9ACTN|nr:SIS domain-containing protein [Jiangella ureilytica]TDC52257.1 sugar isomerase domain-containing protein [Jiangella ureilytica]
MNDVSAAAYLARITEIIDGVATSQLDGVHRAADIVARSVRDGGVVQAFGTGHSQATAMEIAGRAGGLIPTNRIALSDLVMYGGDDPATILDPRTERDPNLAQRLYDLAPIEANDVFVIASNSGINGSIVGMAEVARKNGHPVIAITSLQHGAQVESRHPSGRKLTDFADVVLDNGGPFGDAVLPLPAGGAVCAVSSITAALLAQLLTAEVVRRLIEAGDTPPVYLSANVPGGDVHNDGLLQRYAGRIRRGG